MSSTEKRRSWLAKYTVTATGHPDDSDNTADSPEASPVETRPWNDCHSVPERPPRRASHARWSISSPSQILIPIPEKQLDQQASQLILNALERTSSSQPTPGRSQDAAKSAFSKMSFSSVMGLAGLSLSRTSTKDSLVDDKERGRSISSHKRSASQAPPEEPASRSQSRARSQSPFNFRRFRQRERETSPTPHALPLANSDVDLTDTSPSVRPRNAFTDEPDSGDETVGETDGETDDEYWSDDAGLDPVTERNTERNVFIEPPAVSIDGGEVEDPDPLGEGPNVVVPHEPYFPGSGSSSAARGRNPRRRKSTKLHDPLPLQTSRPVFQRDRCTITLTQGDPPSKLNGRRPKRYIIASDMSEESRYAVEWGIGTVIRDGDQLLIVTVVENENKVDPSIPNATDRAVKLRSQQERQGMAYILVRQATSLLQRTKLHVTVSCQAWHSKNARHMLLDIVDYNEPVMLIVGSRGLGQLKGILLGSTSHYLIEKCSVPVMVARRRLKRPPRRSAHLAKHRSHVSLAEAGIDRVAARVDQDVQVMRSEMQRDDERRDAASSGMASPQEIGEELLSDDDEPEEQLGVKVAGIN